MEGIIINQFISYLEQSQNLNGIGGDVERNLGKGLHREDLERTMEISDATYFADS